MIHSSLVKYDAKLLGCTRKVLIGEHRLRCSSSEGASEALERKFVNGECTSLSCHLAAGSSEATETSGHVLLSGSARPFDARDNLSTCI